VSRELATFLTLSFVIVSLYIDRGNDKKVSNAIWIVIIWLFYSVSIRGIYAIFEFGSRGIALQDSYIDGHPANKIILSMLILAGLIVLIQRKVQFASLSGGNKALFFWYLYCAVSILWSDFPGVAIRRYIKGLGTVIMILIILTENNRDEAFKMVFRKIMFVFVPVSILLIKYYPAIGKFYGAWGGEAIIAGLSDNKNSIGRICAICNFTVVWDFISQKKSQIANLTRPLYIFHIGLSLWLLRLSDSATSLIVLVVGLAIFFLMKLPAVRSRVKGIVIIGFALLLLSAPLANIFYSQLFGAAIDATGHADTFQSRIRLWNDLLVTDSRPLIGYGFRSYWLGERLSAIWSKYPILIPNQAHNGYLDVYLELGIIGLAILLLNTIVIFKRAIASIAIGNEFGIVQLSLLIMVLLYNITESAFRPLHLMWFIFMVIAFEYTKRRLHPLIDSD